MDNRSVDEAGLVQSNRPLLFPLILSLSKDAAVAGVMVRQAHHERLKGLCTSPADEDERQMRAGSVSQIMAGSPNLIIGVIRSAGEANIAAVWRCHSVLPSRLLALIGAVCK
ncbi:MAG: hypothetical protein J4G13_04460 [Dehalococcoidia bacterium]|nr:hypothetical protein [Dehalococcoidia bacterium]